MEIQSEEKLGEIKDVNNTPIKNTKINISDDKSPVSKLANSSQMDDDIVVPDGWSRQTVQRKGGLSAGKCDIYYFSPLGKKLRSRKEIQSYCEKNDIDINMEEFIFKRSINTPTSAVLAKPKKTPNITSPKPAAEPVKKNKLDTPKNSTADTPKKAISRKHLLTTPSNEDINKDDDTPKAKRKRLTKSGLKVSSDGITKVKKLKSISISWVPPESPFTLFQEKLYSKPWQLLIGTIFLNKSGEDNITYDFLEEFLKQWPTPEKVIKSDWQSISESLKTMSNREKKAKMIVKFSDDYVNKSWIYPKELHGIGKFGNDSYRVFCINEWRKVKPSDYLLNFYIDWLWDNHSVLKID